ncbi:hypothetical protein GGI42DRAFT_86647 [Trichoderma sp. SZMC 28013]
MISRIWALGLVAPALAWLFGVEGGEARRADESVNYASDGLQSEGRYLCGSTARTLTRPRLAFGLALRCLALPESKSSQTEPSQMGCSLLGPSPQHCEQRYRYLRGADRGTAVNAGHGWMGWMDGRNPGRPVRRCDLIPVCAGM